MCVSGPEFSFPLTDDTNVHVWQTLQNNPRPAVSWTLDLCHDSRHLHLDRVHTSPGSQNMDSDRAPAALVRGERLTRGTNPSIASPKTECVPSTHRTSSSNDSNTFSPLATSPKSSGSTRRARSMMCTGWFNGWHCIVTFRSSPKTYVEQRYLVLRGGHLQRDSHLCPPTLQSHLSRLIWSRWILVTSLKDILARKYRLAGANTSAI